MENTESHISVKNVNVRILGGKTSKQIKKFPQSTRKVLLYGLGGAEDLCEWVKL